MSEEKKVWTLNPGKARFLFEPSIGMSLSIDNPHYGLPDGLSEEAEKGYLGFLDRAVQDGMLIEGKQELTVKEPEVSESVIDCKAMLGGEVNTNTLKQALTGICSADTRFLPNGKIRSAQNDLEALENYERQNRNRPAVIAMIKKALNGEFGKFKGGITQVKETIEKKEVAVASGFSQESGGDPFAE
jgi:hypothetical protein